MANRSEEKKRLREEREAKERAAAAKAARTKRLQLAGGAVLAIAAIAVLALVLLNAGGDSSSDQPTTVAQAAAIPPPGDLIRNPPEAAKEAGCELRSFPIEGKSHVPEGTKVAYKTNPPTSGNHNAVPAQDGIYEAGNQPAPANWLHALEHGRVLVQYKAGSSAQLVDQLETVASEKVSGTPGYHTLTFQNDTDMPYEVAAVAWGRTLGCKTMNDKVFDAIRAFRNAYTDKGPEIVP